MFQADRGVNVSDGIIAWQLSTDDICNRVF